MLKNLSNFCVNSPLKSLLIGFLFFISLFSGLQYLETDFGYRTWFKESNPKLQYLIHLKENLVVMKEQLWLFIIRKEYLTLK